MSVFGITVTFQLAVLIMLALIFVTLVVIIVMLRRRGNTSDEQYDISLEWLIHTAEQLKDLDLQVKVDDAVSGILEEIRARASIVTTELKQQQQASLTAFTQAAGRELDRFRGHAQRAIGQTPPNYTFQQPQHGLPATAPQQPRVLTSSVPQQALASPVWQAPGNSAQGSGQATGYFSHNGMATGKGLALIEEPQTGTDDLGYSAGYDDVAPQEAEPEVGPEHETEADFGPEQATTPEPEHEPEPEPAPEPVSDVAEPEHMPHTGDDMVADLPQADKEPEPAQPAKPAMWNAEDTLRELPIASLVLNEVNSRFPKTETDMKPVDTSEPAPAAIPEPATAEPHATGSSTE